MTPLISLKPFQCKYKISDRDLGETSFAGLALVRETLREFGFVREMKFLGLKKAGFADDVCLEALTLLLASGGRSLSDWQYLQGDAGFVRMFGIVSVDTLEDYLRRLEVCELSAGVTQDGGRSGYSALLERLHDRLIQKIYVLAGCPKELTFDVDATLIATGKDSALYCYDGYQAYQPMVVYCPELGIVIGHEFRDGNINPRWGYLRMIERCRERVKLACERSRNKFEDVKITARSDSAGYDNTFIDHLHNQGMRYFITAARHES